MDNEQLDNLIKELSAGDSESERQIKRCVDETKLVRILISKRLGNNLTQSALAKKMGCTQAKISKMEHSMDNELCFGDICAYLRATGCNLSMSFTPCSSDFMTQLAHHVMMITQMIHSAMESSDDANTQVELMQLACDINEEIAKAVMPAKSSRRKGNVFHGRHTSMDDNNAVVMFG